MEEVLIKSHLIVTDVHDEYDINWCGKIIGTKPKLKNGMPIFMAVGTRGRMEINTTDMKRVEKCAKLLTQPKGRSSVTTDTSRIYIVEENGNEKILAVVTHSHIKEFAPMFDPVGVK